jgi:hypothetical protein
MRRNYWIVFKISCPKSSSYKEFCSGYGGDMTLRMSAHFHRRTLHYIPEDSTLLFVLLASSLFTEWAGVAVTLCTRIWEVFNSNVRPKHRQFRKFRDLRQSLAVNTNKVPLLGNGSFLSNHFPVIILSFKAWHHTIVLALSDSPHWIAWALS